MKLTADTRRDLARLIAEGDTAQTLMEAQGQRAIRQPDPCWDWEHEAGLCAECDLLLIKLPRPVTLERVVVTLGRAMPVVYEMTHAHVADADGRLMCPDCADGGAPCGQPHDATMCDAPTPVECSHCTGPALPTADYCLECRPYEPDWDKDRYLGIYL
jgi:hypothetical protein